MTKTRQGGPDLTGRKGFSNEAKEKRWKLKTKPETSNPTKKKQEDDQN